MFQSNRRRLNGLIIVALLFVSVFGTFMPSNVRGDSGWLTGWQYRKSHIINGVTSPLTDYQINITLYYGSGTDSAGEVYLNSHSRMDFADLRFTSSDGTTLLNYWVEKTVAGSQITVWVKVPSIPANPGSTSIYVYYGNPTAGSTSNGKSTFVDFYGGGEGWTGWTGGGEIPNDNVSNGFTSTSYVTLSDTVYYPIQRGSSGSWDQYLHTFQPVHKTEITEVNMGGYKYWGYWTDVYGNAIGLARSNDLTNWTKYAGNPILTSTTYTTRWPSVTFDGTTFHMFLSDYGPLSDLNFIKRYTSTDGITFSYVETVYENPGSTQELGAPYIWFNPNDNNYYLYFYETVYGVSNKVRCKIAPTIEGLKSASVTDVMNLRSVEFAPSVLYDNSSNLYWLVTEEDLGSYNWITRAYHSSSPTGGFVEATNSPILTNNDACPIHLLVNNKVYIYYCQFVGPTVPMDWDIRLRIQANPGPRPDGGAYYVTDNSPTLYPTIEGQISTHTTDFISEYRTKNAWSAGKQLCQYLSVSSSQHFGCLLGRSGTDSGSSWYYFVGGASWTQLTAPMVQNQWTSIQRVFNFTADKEWVYINGAYQGYYAWREYGGEVNSIGYVWFALGEAEQGSMWLDVFRTRQYISPEPSHGTWGSEEKNQYVLTVVIIGGGAVSKIPDQAFYDNGTVVTLTASASLGWTFTEWTGDASGTSNTTTVTMTSDKTVTATFTQNVYTLTTSVVGSGSVDLNSTGPYSYGDTVRLTGLPASGWNFKYWSGDITGSANPTTLLMTGNFSVTANFGYPTLYVSPSVVERGIGDIGTTFDVEVTIDNVKDLWGFDFKLGWDGSLLALVNADCNSSLDAIWGSGNWFLAANSSGPGLYQLAAASLKDGFNSTGPQALATLTYQVKDPHSNFPIQTLIQFLTHKLSDSQWHPIENTVEDGTYKMTGSEKPMLNMSPSTETCRKYGETFTIKVDASNIFNVTDFEFEIDFNTTLLDYSNIVWDAWGSGTVTADELGGKIIGYTSGGIMSGDKTLITIEFRTAYHRIWKNVPGWNNDQSDLILIQAANLSYSSTLRLHYARGGSSEIDVGSDVIYTFSPIRGDIDNSGTVEIFDLRTVAAYYDQENATYNLTGDAVIDIYDLVVVASNIGYTYTP